MSTLLSAVLQAAMTEMYETTSAERGRVVSSLDMPSAAQRTSRAAAVNVPSVGSRPSHASISCLSINKLYMKSRMAEPESNGPIA
jgi:hypothetical protein